MTHQLKALSLAFLAVFAISAVAASAAHAEEQFFHSHKERTIIIGENHEGGSVFELTPGVALTCNAVKLEGTQVFNLTHETPGKTTTYTSKTLTLTPTYSECAFAGHPAIVNTTTNQCHTTWYAETTETTAGEPMGNVEVNCKEGGTINIEVPAFGATIHVGNQLIPHAISYRTVNTTTETQKEEITAITTASHIAWTCTPKAICMTGIGANEGKEATLKAKHTLKGFEDLEETSTGTYKEGAQTGIFYGPTQ